MKRFLLIAVLAGTSLVSQGAVDIGIGINIGPPPAPRILRVRPGAPGLGYVWIDGYWYAEGGRYRWHSGYWSRPPYEGSVWVAPRYEGGRFFPGYWNGDRGRIDHDHRWDRGRDRDYNRH